MKPILVLQHEVTQGPGVLLDHLESHGLPYHLCMSPLDGRAPVSARDYSGVVVLGSDRSVNDLLPWIEQEHALLQDAVQRHVPVLGHCFGAQLLARSLGASRTLYGPHCLNKGFCLGPHWAFQGHLEVTADSIRQWCDHGRCELEQVYGPAAQDAEHILLGLDQHLSTLHLIARQTYQRWTDQLLERAGVALAQIHMPSLYAGQ
ncbi:glutamine amidotransferase [Alcaligenes faecalis]|uniref:type 1 glutamine amidotransferase n=1 Tax=Alcaligenes faecalis TaxID=511 RepID=UPI0019331DB1|nr:type 1 glutamine amidotransferase [Alcaligenes faecalis]QRF91142.1 glutamine amidotransferase [Alcaligenes faecalis]